MTTPTEKDSWAKAFKSPLALKLIAMDNQDESDERIKRLILTLRDITLAVQIAPFVVSLFYIVGIIVQTFCPVDTAWFFSILLFTPPPIIIIMLIFSRILRLCRWHRLASAIPLVPFCFTIIDAYLIELTDLAVYILNGITACMTILLLAAAYNVFLKPHHYV